MLFRSIEIISGGRVLVGADTVDIAGLPTKKGTFLRASASVSISSQRNADGVGIELYAGGGISTHNNSGTIILDSAGDIDLQGPVVSGGLISLVQDPAGATIGYNVTRQAGTATLQITSDARIRTGQEVYASQFITMDAGIDSTTPGDQYSGIGIVILGSSTARTGSANS